MENGNFELRQAVDTLVKETTEKVKTQADDHKLILKLSKRLENLLINVADMKKIRKTILSFQRHLSMFRKI